MVHVLRGARNPPLSLPFPGSRHSASEGSGEGSLLSACLASVIGGPGNGVQWVAVLNALQQATVPAMQLRVMALYESVVTAMPAAGFALGGGIAALLWPRAAYLAAAGGVFVTLVVAGAALRHSRRRQPPLRRAITASIRP